MTEHFDAIMSDLKSAGRVTIDAARLHGLRREAAALDYTPLDFKNWFRASFPDSLFDIRLFADPFCLEIVRRPASAAA